MLLGLAVKKGHCRGVDGGGRGERREVRHDPGLEYHGRVLVKRVVARVGIDVEEQAAGLGLRSQLLAAQVRLVAVIIDVHLPLMPGGFVVKHIGLVDKIGGTVPVDLLTVPAHLLVLLLEPVEAEVSLRQHGFCHFHHFHHFRAEIWRYALGRLCVCCEHTGALGDNMLQQ